jgi:hypothetical protein
MRGQPTYDLQQLQQLVGQGPLSRVLTVAATNGAGAMGFSNEQIIEAVLQLTPIHFYKTMESEQVLGLWQDVYHLPFRNKEVYIKLQMGHNGRAYVVQFKRK